MRKFLLFSILLIFIVVATTDVQERFKQLAQARADEVRGEMEDRMAERLETLRQERQENQGGQADSRVFALPQARSGSSVASAAEGERQKYEFQARAFLEANREAWGLRHHHIFRAEVLTSPLGARVHFTVWDKDYLVSGLGIDVQVDRNGVATEIGRNYAPVEEFDGEKNAALSLGAIQELHKSKYQIAEDSLVEKPFLLVPPGGQELQLAYAVSIREIGSRFLETVYLRASDGQLIGKSRPRKEF